jgi:hypothetical protein
MSCGGRNAPVVCLVGGSGNNGKYKMRNAIPVDGRPKSQFLILHFACPSIDELTQENSELADY